MPARHVAKQEICLQTYQQDMYLEPLADMYVPDSANKALTPNEKHKYSYINTQGHIQPLIHIPRHRHTYTQSIYTNTHTHIYIYIYAQHKD